MAIKDYIRERFFPHMWCPGCGHGIVLNSMLRAIEKQGISKNDIVMVSGIGCSARISGYVDFHTLHTIHGRALAFATGVKMSMTGGQYSPLSGYGIRATTAPYMNIDHDFDVVELSKAAGATFVARTTTYHVQQIEDIIEKAILHKGFSVVEIMSQCPTYFGRKNKEGSAVDMLKRYKETTTPIGSKAKKENPDLIERGIFVQKEMPEYCSEYDKVIEMAMKGN
jgi:2-oxoglutarate ferredoxin oxidoreductase subunit beta